MALVNTLIGDAVDVLLFPLRTLSPIIGLTIISLITACGMLLVVKKTSDQRRLIQTRRSIHAALFEILLFRDDVRAVLRAQGELLRHNATYLRLSLVPMLWMMMPLLLLISHLDTRYGYRGLEPGQSVLVKAHVREFSRGADASRAASDEESPFTVALDTPEGIRVETPAVWIPALQETVWRISALRPGEYDLTLRVAGETVRKSVLVSDEVGVRSPARLEPTFLTQFLYPAERPLPEDSAVRSILVDYPRATIRVFAWNLDWIPVFLILSIAFAFAMKGRFGVTL